MPASMSLTKKLVELVVLGLHEARLICWFQTLDDLDDFCLARLAFSSSKGFVNEVNGCHYLQLLHTQGCQVLNDPVHTSPGYSQQPIRYVLRPN